MGDNCLKNKCMQTNTKYVFTFSRMFSFYSIVKTSVFYNLFSNKRTTIPSLFSIQNIQDNSIKTDCYLFQNILSRRIDTQVSVFNCSL